MVVLGRAKKFGLRMKAALRRNRYGLVPIKKAPATIWTRKTKLAKLIVLVLVVYTCSPASSFCPALTTAPKVSAEWVLSTLANHNLGKPIEATLKITSPAALFVDPDSLRQEGETFGNFEVRGRADPHVYYIEEESEVRKVTEFKYTLQYLKPLDEGVFAKRALPPTYFEYRYRRQYSSGVCWVEGKAHTEKTELYLFKRVQPGDQPFPLAGEVPEGQSFGWILKIVGIAVVLAVPVLHLAKFVVSRSRARRIEKEVQQKLSDLFWELRKRWIETGDYRHFLVATVLARDQRKKQLGLREGELLPRDTFWQITTQVLYSGRRLEAAEVSKVFELLADIFKEGEDAV